jgi:hypothetical protein
VRFLRPAAWTTGTRTVERRNRIEQRVEELAVVDARRRQEDRERNPLRLRELLEACESTGAIPVHQVSKGRHLEDWLCMAILKGTLDVLVLKALSWGPMHGFEIIS